MGGGSSKQPSAAATPANQASRQSSAASGAGATGATGKSPTKTNGQTSTRTENTRDPAGKRPAEAAASSGGGGGGGGTGGKAKAGASSSGAGAGGGGGGGAKKAAKKKEPEVEIQTFVHKNGQEYQVCQTEDGTRYYLDVNVTPADWVLFPADWERQGKFVKFHRVVFCVWTEIATRKEYLTFEENGVRHYCDFARGQWLPFPQEWLDPRRGTFGEEVDPDAWAQSHQSAYTAAAADEPVVSTYTDASGVTFTTYMGPEITEVWYYLDDKELKWKKMPKKWVYDMKVKEGMPLDEDEQMLFGGAVDSKDANALMEDELASVKAQLKLANKQVASLQEAERLKDTFKEETERVETKFEEIMASNKLLSKEKLELKNKIKELTKTSRKAKKDADDKIARLEEELKVAGSGGGGGGGGGGGADAARMQELLRAKEAEIEKLNAKIAQMSAALHTAADAKDSVRAVSASVGTLETQADALRRESKDVRKSIVEQREQFTVAIADFGRALRDRLEGQSLLVQEYQSKYRAESLKRKLLYNKLQELRGNIRVYCRARTLLRDEISSGEVSCLTFPDENEITITSEEGAAKSFEFDMVFGPQATQEEVFADMEPLILSVVDGYNVCVFAYGQTGAGKTYTMMGPKTNRGVNFRALDKLFNTTKEDRDTTFTIVVSYIEIYNEEIRDLLNPEDASSGWGGKKERKKFEIRRGPNGMMIPDVTEVPVRNTADCVAIMERGDKARAVTATAMNDVSSRSHSVMQVMVSGQNRISGTTTVAKLTLVDLAGSERVGKSQATGQALTEAAAINKSLSCLGNCIAALQTKKPHIPYRDSKLTNLLQDSLGGDSKTLMFLNLGPCRIHHAESVQSLQFGQRVRSVVLGPATKGGAERKGGAALPMLPDGTIASVPLPPRAGPADD